MMSIIVLRLSVPFCAFGPAVVFKSHSWSLDTRTNSISPSGVATVMDSQCPLYDFAAKPPLMHIFVTMAGVRHCEAPLGAGTFASAERGDADFGDDATHPTSAMAATCSADAAAAAGQRSAVADGSAPQLRLLRGSNTQ